MTKRDFSKLNAKIDWEGGMLEYFFGYTGGKLPDDLEGTAIEDPHTRLMEAWDDFLVACKKLGITGESDDGWD